MWEPLHELIFRWFGRREDDPQATISVDQLAIVLKSIEEKFNALKEDHGRLQERVAVLQAENSRLSRALANESSADGTLASEDAEARPPSQRDGARAC